MFSLCPPSARPVVTPPTRKGPGEFVHLEGSPSFTFAKCCSRRPKRWLCALAPPQVISSSEAPDGSSSALKLPGDLYMWSTRFRGSSILYQQQQRTSLFLSLSLSGELLFLFDFDRESRVSMVTIVGVSSPRKPAWTASSWLLNTQKHACARSKIDCATACAPSPLPQRNCRQGEKFAALSFHTRPDDDRKCFLLSIGAYILKKKKGNFFISPLT